MYEDFNGALNNSREDKEASLRRMEEMLGRAKTPEAKQQIQKRIEEIKSSLNGIK